MQDACPNPDDLLPGLCALAQGWLTDVALPGFRDAPSQAGSLADWFDDRRVALYLQVIPCHHTLAAYPSCVVNCCVPWLSPQVAAPQSASQTNFVLDSIMLWVQVLLPCQLPKHVQLLGRQN